jgi:hypothetical protein
MEKKELKEAIAGIMKDKTQREALAQLIIEYVQPNHLSVDVIGMLLNSRSLNPGDALVKKVRKGIKVHTWVPGSIGLKSEITVSERINYILDSAIVGVLANEWDLESGELGTIESIRTEAQAKLRDYYLAKVFTMLSSVWSAVNTPSNYTNVGAPLTVTALDNMIQTINNTTSGAKAIVGVRSALQPITKFGAFWSTQAGLAGTVAPVQTQLEEVMRTGWLGQYSGVPIIALKQEYDSPETYSALLPTDKVLVIGENVGEFVTFGAERSKEWTDFEPTPPYWHLDIVQQFGIIVDNAQGIGVLKVT